MSTDPYGRNTAAWQRLRATVIANATHCSICGKPLRKDLPGTHRLGPTADHIIELQDGGSLLDPANVRAACRSCNSRKGARRKNQRNRQAPQPPEQWCPTLADRNPSREW